MCVRFFVLLSVRRCAHDAAALCGYQYLFLTSIRFAEICAPRARCEVLVQGIRPISESFSGFVSVSQIV